MEQTTVWIFGFFAVVSLASVLARRPWTSIIARRYVSLEVQSTALFYETNMVISSGWSLLFGLAALLSAVTPTWVNMAFGTILFLLGRCSPRIAAWYAAQRQKINRGGRH